MSQPAAEPGVIVGLATTPAQLDGAGLVIAPGTRVTVSDLGWLPKTGLAAAIAGRAARGLPVLGIRGGYQMLARSIRDEVESRAGTVPGLSPLPATVTFRAAKTLTRPAGQALGERVAGCEIRHGVVTPEGGEPFPGGCAAGSVRGTTWHGIFENDAFRRDLAARAGRDFTPAPDVGFAAVRERRCDALAGLVEEHLDTGALAVLIEGGGPGGAARGRQRPRPGLSRSVSGRTSRWRPQ